MDFGGALRQAAESFKEEDIPVEDQGIIQAIETEGDSCADFIKTADPDPPKDPAWPGADDVFFNAQTAHFYS